MTRARPGLVEFAEVVYRDHRWLNAEFDAIVAANFGATARPWTPVRRRNQPLREGGYNAGRRDALLPAPVAVAGYGWIARLVGARQRSPPRRTGGRPVPNECQEC